VSKKPCWICGEKYEVLCPHIGAHDDERIKKALEKHLLDLAEKLGRTPKQDEMVDADGRPSATPYNTHFGSWNEALLDVGLSPHRPAIGATTDELLEEISRLKKENNKIPSQRDMNEMGKYSAGKYFREFGTWNDAIKQAGFNIPNIRKNNINHDQLLDELRRLRDEKGRPPTQEEVMIDGEFSIRTYRKQFGGHISALQEAGMDVDHGRIELALRGPDHPRWQGGTNIDYGDGWNESKRKSIRRRDNHQCQKCGLSQTKHMKKYDQLLHVHHIEPARTIENDTDRNSPSNLTTLCISCHRIVENALD